MRRFGICKEQDVKVKTVSSLRVISNISNRKAGKTYLDFVTRLETRQPTMYHIAASRIASGDYQPNEPYVEKKNLRIDIPVSNRYEPQGGTTKRGFRIMNEPYTPGMVSERFAKVIPDTEPRTFANPLSKFMHEQQLQSIKQTPGVISKGSTSSSPSGVLSGVPSQGPTGSSTPI
jgi:hypothetical protein